MSIINVASLQMISTPRVEENLSVAASLIAQAARQGAQIVLLPEYFCLMGFKDSAKLDIQEAFGQGPIQKFLAEQAKAHGVFVIAGTLPLSSEVADKVYNSCLVYNPQGQCISRYDKIHLFCFSQGAESYNEGNTLVAGSTPVVAQVNGLSVGLSICYDLRFPELYRAMGTVDLIVMPAAFTYTTGQAHWELLIRARAVENQCYVLACGQGGTHENGRRTFGHSMLVDPWGRVCNLLQEGEGVVLGMLDTDKISEVRANLPALTHKKVFQS
jgi:deaminated glutathione amidase